MERCPCCNARLNGAVICPRCQTPLGGVIDTEQLADLCLKHAMDFWFSYQPQLAIQSLSLALKLKKTPSALVFRDFIVQKQIQQVFSLLVDKKNTEAKELLALLHDLHPRHLLLNQLQGFTYYLLDKQSPRHALLKQLQTFTEHLLAYKG